MSLDDDLEVLKQDACPDTACPPLSTLRIAESEGRVTMVLAGEFDLASRPLFDEALEQVAGSRVQTLVLDLSEVTFMDSTGLHAVLKVKTLCAERRCEFLLVPGSTQVQRLFALTGIRDELRLSHESAAA